jgi:hypothetical protein
MDEQHTLTIGGPPVVLGRPEEWDAPDGVTAQRWADEVNARGGRAEITVIARSDGSHQQWKVRILRAISQHRITPSP